MLPTRIFRSRKAALIWAALICWGAAEFASGVKTEDGAVPPPSTAVAATAKSAAPGPRDSSSFSSGPESLTHAPGQFSPLEEPPPM